MDNPTESSIDYYRDRERHELELASSAALPNVRDIHVAMARTYRELIDQLSGGNRVGGATPPNPAPAMPDPRFQPPAK